jgi:hypothetical protein
MGRGENHEGRAIFKYLIIPYSSKFMKYLYNVDRVLRGYQVSDVELIRIMDQLLLAALQEVPGLSYQVELPGMIGYRSDVIPNPYANLVGLTRAA